MRQQPGIDEIYLYAKDPYEAKYQLSIRKRKDVGTKFLMMLKLLVNAQIVWMIFMKTLSNTTQIKVVKCYLLLMICLLICLVKKI